MLPRCAVPFVLLATCLSGQLPGQSSQKVSLNAVDKLELHNVKADFVSYRGVVAVRIADAAATDVGDAGRLAVVRQMPNCAHNSVNVCSSRSNSKTKRSFSSIALLVFQCM
ncbi:MAG: hypothetical protein ACLPY1_19155 [Terracidiphilus sp.]